MTFFLLIACGSDPAPDVVAPVARPAVEAVEAVEAPVEVPSELVAPSAEETFVTCDAKRLQVLHEMTGDRLGDACTDAAFDQMCAEDWFGCHASGVGCTADCRPPCAACEASCTVACEACTGPDCLKVRAWCSEACLAEKRSCERACGEASSTCWEVGSTQRDADCGDCARFDGIDLSEAYEQLAPKNDYDCYLWCAR